MSKIKNGGLDQYGAKRLEQQQFGTAGVEGVKAEWHMSWAYEVAYQQSRWKTLLNMLTTVTKLAFHLQLKILESSKTPIFSNVYELSLNQ